MEKFHSYKTIPYGSGDVLFVHNTRDCDNFSWLTDQTVDVDGRSVIVTGVRLRNGGPYKKGDVIGLITKYTI